MISHVVVFLRGHLTGYILHLKMPEGGGSDESGCKGPVVAKLKWSQHLQLGSRRHVSSPRLTDLKILNCLAVPSALNLDIDFCTLTMFFVP